MVNNFKKILVICPYGIGDTLFATPLLRVLKKTFPSSKLSVLIGSRTEELVKNNPYVDDIIIDDKDFWRSKRLWKLRRNIYFLKFQNQKYDVSMDLSLSREYGWLSKFILKIPIRVGFNFRNRGVYLTHKLDLPHGFYGEHMTRYYLETLKLLGIEHEGEESLSYDFKPHLNEEQRKNVEKKFSPILARKKKTVAIFPGGGASWGEQAEWRLWHFSHFASLIDMLVSHYDVDVVLLGDRKEKNLGSRIQAMTQTEVFNLTGEFTLSEIGWAFSSCVSFVLCNDGGPFHLAMSQKTPVLGIYGPVSELVYGTPDKVLTTSISSEVKCRPCYYQFRIASCALPRCLTELTPETVFAHVDKHFRQVF